MNQHTKRFGSWHTLLCLAIIVIAVLGVLAGLGAGLLLIALVGPVMMGGRPSAASSRFSGVVSTSSSVSAAQYDG